MHKHFKKTIDSYELNKAQRSVFKTTNVVIIDFVYLLKRMKTNSYEELVTMIAAFVGVLFTTRPSLNTVLFGGSLSNECRFFASHLNVPYDELNDRIASPLYGKENKKLHNASVLADTYSLTFGALFPRILSKIRQNTRMNYYDKFTIGTLFPLPDLKENIYISNMGVTVAYVSTECVDCMDDFCTQIARQQTWIQAAHAFLEVHTDIDPSLIPTVSNEGNCVYCHEYIAILDEREMAIPSYVTTKDDTILFDRQKVIDALPREPTINTIFISAISETTNTYPTNLSPEQVAYVVNDETKEPKYDGTEFVDSITVETINNLVQNHRKINTDKAVYPSDDEFVLNTRAAREIKRICRLFGYAYADVTFADSIRVPNLESEGLADFMGKRTLKFRKVATKMDTNAHAKILERYPPAFFSNVSVGVYIPKRAIDNEYGKMVTDSLKRVSVNYADKMMHLNEIWIDWIADYARVFLQNLPNPNASLCFLAVYCDKMYRSTHYMAPIRNPDDTKEKEKETQTTTKSLGPILGMEKMLSQDAADVYVILGYKKKEDANSFTKSKFGQIYFAKKSLGDSIRCPSRVVWMHLAPSNISDLFDAMEKEVAIVPSPVLEVWNYAHLMQIEDRRMLHLKVVFEQGLIGLIEWKLNQSSIKHRFSTIQRASEMWKTNKWSKSWIDALRKYRIQTGESVESVMYHDTERLTLMCSVLPVAADESMHVSINEGRMVMAFNKESWSQDDIAGYVYAAYVKITKSSYLDFNISEKKENFYNIKFNIDGNAASNIMIYQML